MSGVNYLAVVVAAVAAFVISSVWYAIFGRQLARLGSATVGMRRPPPWVPLVEAGRSLLIAAALAGFAARLAITSWTGGVLLALAAWTGFVLWLYSGSVIWEKVPWRLAAIHAGDALVKMVVLAVIVSIWR